MADAPTNQLAKQIAAKEFLTSECGIRLERVLYDRQSYVKLGKDVSPDEVASALKKRSKSLSLYLQRPNGLVKRSAVCTMFEPFCFS